MMNTDIRSYMLPKRIEHMWGSIKRLRRKLADRFERNSDINSMSFQRLYRRLDRLCGKEMLLDMEYQKLNKEEDKLPKVTAVPV